MRRKSVNLNLISMNTKGTQQRKDQSNIPPKKSKSNKTKIMLFRLKYQKQNQIPPNKSHKIKSKNLFKFLNKINK